MTREFLSKLKNIQVHNSALQNARFKSQGPGYYILRDAVYLYNNTYEDPGAVSKQPETSTWTRHGLGPSATPDPAQGLPSLTLGLVCSTNMPGTIVTQLEAH